ncbi:MAG: dienelactone hydrolase family protein [Spirochaetales bacterium]|nr:dienelactone hydrolase family protein [Spirochaetales bacterium]
MKRIWLISIVLFLMSLPLFADDSIHTEEITYTVDGQKLVGLLAYDQSTMAKRPGVLVVHEWQGINDYAKKRAVDLAKEGYVAFALDMYGDGKEIPRSEAGAKSRSVGSDFTLIEKRFNAALAILNKNKYTDSRNTAAIGYCFGGGVVLNMARLGTEIKGVVGFHSSLNTGLTAEKGDIKTRILAIQGDKDPVAPPERQTAFRNEMNASGADYNYIIYENVEAHNFTNPAGSSYYEKEAEMAWDSMLEFFDSIF